MAIEHTLQALGLRDPEAQVYLSLAQVGKATAHMLSKRVKLPRTSVYWLLENLVKRGLVSQERQRHTTFFFVNQPSAFRRMVENEKQELNAALRKKELAAQEIVGALAPYFSTKTMAVPRFQFFEGKDSVQAMLYDYLPEWQASIAGIDDTWWGYQDPSFVEPYLGWLKHGWKVKGEKERYQVMTNRVPIEEALERLAPHRKMKYVPAHISFSSTIWVLGDYIVLIMTARQPHYAFQVKEPLFAANLRAVFQMLWEGGSSS